ncbi:hypothetical protein ACWCYZ_17480 [Streptomyces virginiae]
MGTSTSHEAVDVATKRDVDESHQALSAEIASVRRDLSAEIAELRRSATAQITSLPSEGSEAQEVTDLGLIPATEVKPEGIGVLSLRYVDGQPQLVVSGGTSIPAGLTVVDGSGSAVAVYAAGAVAPTAARYAVYDFEYEVDSPIR